MQSVLLCFLLLFVSASTLKVYGPDVKIADTEGRARTFVQYNPDKMKLKSVGLDIDNAVFDQIMDSNPFAPDEANCFDGVCLPSRENELEFPVLPEEVDQQLIYDHVVLDWGLYGHPPEDVWDIPHFDMHFYSISRRERLSMTPGPCIELVDCDMFEVATAPVDPQYFPLESDGWLWTEAVVPNMGDHYIHTLLPEFAGGSDKFNASFVFGRYDGRFSFHEVMSPLRYFDWVRTDGVETCHQVPETQAYPFGGAWPATYCITPHEAGVTLAFSDMDYEDGVGRTGAVKMECEDCKDTCREVCKTADPNKKECRKECKKAFCDIVC